MIQVFEQSLDASSFDPGASITEDTAGIPGAVEAGDKFGKTVVVGFALLCQESVDVGVGAPFEGIGDRRDAGSVTLISLIPGVTCAARALSQGSWLADRAEAGDQVGLGLGLTRGRTDLEED
jgi:hypothetical protein